MTEGWSVDTCLLDLATGIFGKPPVGTEGSRFREAIAPGSERDGGDHNQKSIYSCYCGSLQYHDYPGQ